MKNERLEIIKQAKKEHKSSLKNRAHHKIERDNLVKRMLGSDTPKWGSLRIKMLSV